MQIDRRPYGTTVLGQPVDEYRLDNGGGCEARILTYGGVVTHLLVPDRSGKAGDVLLGFDSLAEYERFSPFFGSLVGRVANRIADGTFTLDGTTYKLPVNNGPNTLHGGMYGHDKRVWAAQPIYASAGPTLKLTLRDPHGSEGFPGTLDVAVYYTLTRAGGLLIQYLATTDRPTPVNLTNHAYFNLRDAGASDVLGHEVRIEADEYTPADAALIPTGEVASVSATPFDFRQAKPVGRDLGQVRGEPPGYDHNFVVRGPAGGLRVAAEVYEPTSGRVLRVRTTEPGVQFYTGNFLDGSIAGKGGVRHGRHSAFCLETQHFPDSPNRPQWPTTILRPSEVYRHVTEYAFSVKG